MHTRLGKVLDSPKTATFAALVVALIAMGSFQLFTHFELQDVDSDLSIHITTVLFSAFIVALVVYVYVSKLKELHLQWEAIRVEQERMQAHKDTMCATYHYLNNALNQFQLVLLQYDTKGTIDADVIEAIKTEIHRTATEVVEFGKLENPTKENIEKFIKERLQHNE